MIVATYSQKRKLQNHIAKIGIYLNLESPDFGKYYLDVQKEWGGSRNGHGFDPCVDTVEIEKYLAKNGFHKIS